MSGPSAVHWLDTTFKSRERTAELLRPDLESGLITQNDYHTAVAFLPGPHRYYPVFYSATSTAVFFAVGRARRWQLTSPRNFAFGFLSNFVGLIWGQFERAKVHYRFARQLENPTGFSQALQNVNVRTGGKEPLRWALPGADTELLKKGLAGSGSMAEEGQSRDEDWVREPQITSDVPQTDYSSSNTADIPPQNASASIPTPAARSQTKWDEIRNARAGAQSSAWDALRQQHEREKILERQQRQQRGPDSSSSGASGSDDLFTSPPSRYNDDDRAKEQARFDAMLEAERRMSRE